MKTVYFLLILALVSPTQWYQEGNPKMLTHNNFNLTINDDSHSKFVKFFTPWCKFCRILKSVIDQHQQNTYQNRTDIKFYEINCHQSPQVCMPLGVYSVPFVILFDKQGKQKQNASGVYPKEWYVNMINSHSKQNIKENKKKAGKRFNDMTSESQIQNNTVLSGMKKNPKENKASQHQNNIQQQLKDRDISKRQQDQRKQAIEKLNSKQTQFKYSQNQSQVKNEISRSQVPKQPLQDKQDEPLHYSHEAVSQDYQPTTSNQFTNHSSNSQSVRSNMKKEQYSASQFIPFHKIKSIYILAVGLIIGIVLYYKLCSFKRNLQRPI